MKQPPTPQHSDFHFSDFSSEWASTERSEIIKQLADKERGDERPLQPPPPRRTTQPVALTDDAHVWLSRLPPRYQPLATARAHPHIVNRLCLMWGNNQEMLDYLNELLISNRPGREGFAFDVMTELSDLQGLLEQAQQYRKT